MNDASEWLLTVNILIVLHLKLNFSFLISFIVEDITFCSSLNDLTYFNVYCLHFNWQLHRHLVSAEMDHLWSSVGVSKRMGSGHQVKKMHQITPIPEQFSGNILFLRKCTTGLLQFVFTIDRRYIRRYSNTLDVQICVIEPRH